MVHSHHAAGHSDLNATRTVQRRYRRIAGVYDKQEALPERLLFARLRRSLWSRVRGQRVLEVGVGTGKNAAYYPAGARMVAVDLVPAMATRAARREVYSTIIETARRLRPDLEIALCLEEQALWESTGLLENMGRCNCRL